MNVAALDELVREYCMYRGLIEGGSSFTQGASRNSNDAVVAQLSDVLAAGVVNGFKAVGARGQAVEPTPPDTEQVVVSIFNSTASDCQPEPVVEDVSALTGLQDDMNFSSPKGLPDAPHDAIMDDTAVLISEGTNYLHLFNSNRFTSSSLAHRPGIVYDIIVRPFGVGETWSYM